jgi:hypothetical protein
VDERSQYAYKSRKQVLTNLHNDCDGLREAGYGGDSKLLGDCIAKRAPLYSLAALAMVMRVRETYKNYYYFGSNLRDRSEAPHRRACAEPLNVSHGLRMGLQAADDSDRVLGRASNVRIDADRDGNCETAECITPIGPRKARPVRLARPCSVPSDAKRPALQLGADLQDGIDFPIESEGIVQVVQRSVDTNPASSSS